MLITGVNFPPPPKHGGRETNWDCFLTVCGEARCGKTSRRPAQPPSLYSVEYSPYAPHRAGRSSTPDTLGDDDDEDRGPPPPPPPAFPYATAPPPPAQPHCVQNGALSRPMTPRRVKRRSVTRMSTRHNPTRHSARSVGSGAVARAAAAAGVSLRASLRATRTNNHVNPVARLIDHPRGLCPPGDSSSTEESTGRLAFGHTLLLPQYRMQATSGGHSNPTYQSSQPGSTLSLDADSSRPPSARSSYSNYHGQRRQPVAAGFGAGRATGQVPVGGNSTSTFSHHRASNTSSLSPLGARACEDDRAGASMYLHGLDSETVI